MGARRELLAGAEGGSCSVLETMDRLEGALSMGVGGAFGKWGLQGPGPEGQLGVRSLAAG